MAAGTPRSPVHRPTPPSLETKTHLAPIGLVGFVHVADIFVRSRPPPRGPLRSLVGAPAATRSNVAQSGLHEARQARPPPPRLPGDDRGRSPGWHAEIGATVASVGPLDDLLSPAAR